MISHSAAKSLFTAAKPLIVVKPKAATVSAAKALVTVAPIASYVLSRPTIRPNGKSFPTTPSAFAKPVARTSSIPPAINSTGPAQEKKLDTAIATLSPALSAAPLPTISEAPQEPEESMWEPPSEPSTTDKSVEPAKEKAAIVVTTSASPPKPSLWVRFLTFLGFRKRETGASIHGEGLQSMIEGVVKRARCGDQNAMALIALVRDNAAKGDPKAATSLLLLKEYVKANPVGFGYEPDYVALTQAVGTRWAGDDVFCDGVALSHGPVLTNHRVREGLGQFGGEARNAAQFGMSHLESESKRNDVKAGQILGHARRLQAVRMRESSLTKFDPVVGWELGE